MDPLADEEWQSAHSVRSLLAHNLAPPATFRAGLMGVPPNRRDAWVDAVFGLGELPGDGPDLPSGCVPYLPCSVETMLRVVEHAPVRASDVFVDVGAGVGRAAVLVHLLTGASARGLEIQGELARAARDLVTRLSTPRVSIFQGDAAHMADALSEGSVFFLYCPFGGERLARVLEHLELAARARSIRVCFVDMPPPACSWLTMQEAPSGALAIYRSQAFPPASPSVGC